MSSGAYGSMPIRPSSTSRRIVRSERTTPRFYEGDLGYGPARGVDVVPTHRPERALSRASGCDEAAEAPEAQCGPVRVLPGDRPPRRRSTLRRLDRDAGTGHRSCDARRRARLEPTN